MTYPPQPGQPQGQPDPYGQGGPQSGGFPQQGGQQFGQPGDPYGQQQPQYGQPGDPYSQQQQFGQDPYGQQQFAAYPGQAGGGFGAPPPPKSKKGLWIALGAVVVVLAAFAITAFVAPGFLLSDEKGGSSDPKATAQAIADGINSKNKDSLNGLKCPDAEKQVQSAIDSVQQTESAQLNGEPRKVSDTEYTATVNVKTAKEKSGAPYELGLGKNGDNFCWKKIGIGDLGGSGPPTGSSTTTKKSTSSSSKSGSGTGGTRNPEAKALVDNFISKVNAGDTSGAQSMFCADVSSSDKDSLNDAKTGNANLTTKNGTDVVEGYMADLSGSYKSGEANGMVSSEEQGGKLCIDTFILY